MEFIDEAEIIVKSGDGGHGCVSFRREKYLPKGGPDGGDGGKGGDIILRASRRLYSLYDFVSRRHFRAQNGRPGSGRDRSGRKGRSIEILVPVGTIIRDAETREVLADFVQDNERLIVVEGGRGGKGNRHFATATNQTPRFAQEGQKGQEKKLKLELKLIADAGIIGLPNAGKSTLLSCLSNAHPKIASYPFTTLIPNLGVIIFDDEKTLTLADIPGLIEGAGIGRGLGHRFLRHIERTSFLLHLVDTCNASCEDILRNFRVVQAELQQFHPSLVMKTQVIVLNKIDLAGSDRKEILAACQAFNGLGYECVAISALTGEGLEQLKEVLANKAPAQTKSG